MSIRIAGSSSAPRRRRRRSGFRPGLPGHRAGRTKVRVGYLHTLAVDGQMWLADAPGRLAEERPRPRVPPVHHRPRALPGDGRRQHRHALHRRGDLQLPGARPGQDVPHQRRRVRHRAALGARGPGHQVASPTSRASASPPPPAPPRTCSSTRRCAPTSSIRQGRRDRQPAHGRGGDLVHLRRGAGGGAVGAVQRHGARQGAGREEAGRRLGLLPAGRDRRRLGGLATTIYAKNREVLQRVVRAWAEGNDDAREQDRRGARDPAEEALQAGAAAPTSRSSSARRRCSRTPNGAS